MIQPPQRRADHRRDHDGYTVDRECLSTFRGRERIGQDRLLAGRHAAAAEPLQDAEHDQRLQAPRKTAQERGERKHGDADHVEALAADHGGEPAGDRQHDRIGHEIACDHIGALVDADGQPTRDMAERDIGDRGVQHFHEGGDRDHEGDQIGIVAGGSGPLRRPTASSSAAFGSVGHRTFVQGTTDMPGPTARSAGHSSIVILTGTRCTTFT